MEYRIKLSEENIKLVSRALELFSRISAGQFNEVKLCYTIEKRSWDLSETDRGHYEAYLSLAAQIITGMERGASFGIFHPALEQEAKVAYHIERSIRHQLWKDSPDKPINVTSAYPADIVEGLEVPIEKEITGENVARELFIIHTHAEEANEQNPDEIVYRERDLLPVLQKFGLPEPDWAANARSLGLDISGIAKEDKTDQPLGHIYINEKPGNMVQARVYVAGIEALTDLLVITMQNRPEFLEASREALRIVDSPARKARRGAKGSEWTMEDIRQYNVMAMSFGKTDEWFVMLWMGFNDKGIKISRAYNTEKEANEQADKIAKYIAPLFLRD